MQERREVQNGNNPNQVLLGAGHLPARHCVQHLSSTVFSTFQALCSALSKHVIESI